LVAEFSRHYGFVFDDYQRQACGHVEAGSGVLVAAPTGAGKTIVGEFAVFLALRQGRKCFYTTPIKALSNQKYADLVARHGPDQVGLLTGDSSINSEAPVVVMTTEVLRNMLYAGSRTLRGLGFVVMDEVHYLADRFRGAVWEEVIIGLPESIQVIALSATVSNAEEFGDWLAEVRGAMQIVVSERRPVPLFQHVLVGTQLYDLFAGVAPTAALDDSPAAKADVNPALVRIARDEARWVRDDSRRPRGRSGKGQRKVNYGSGSFGGASRASLQRGPDGRGGDRRARTSSQPSRPELVNALDGAALLPAIVFIFSRIGCDAAVSQVLGSGLVLTSRIERAAIAELLGRHVAALGDADLRVLRYDSFAEALSRGVAAHHAGMLPAFKECVEEAFAGGLVKVVFATETLALGINMPARSVVLEKLVKYNGESHVDVTPGEYTQLTGRAGRRGIDVEGHAVVLWRSGLDPRALAGLAARRTYPLTSSFAPTYNMAVNLVGSVGRERARSLLEQSFAQFQSDRSVVGLARAVSRNEESIAEYLRTAACELGDFGEYARLRARIADMEAGQSRTRQAERRAQALGSLEDLRPGDIVRVPSGKSQGFAVVLDPGTRDHSGPRGRHQPGGPRPQVMTEDRHIRRLSLVDFPTPAVVVGRVKVPRHFDSGQAASRRSLAAAFHSKLKTLDSEALRHRPTLVDPETSAAIAELRAQVRTHPCHDCPDREQHARWAERALRLERENAKIEQRVASRTNTIAAHFDKICLVLESLGYLDDGSRVTDRGRQLARIYTELDLVAAECLRANLFDGLSHPQLAAVLASFVYEARRSDGFEHRSRMPDAATARVMSQVRTIWRDVSLLERDHRLERGPEPDIGFSEAAFGWAAGRPLGEVLTESGLTAGDFVRWVRQVLDFADQIGQAAGPGPLRETVRQLSRAMRRGVVDYTPDDSDEPEGRVES
jgi:ATP-dependent RNA helicase HelY